ncbi:hypothetical protein CKA32_003236 [Geitlerinema sp. FC II]|nr:hypothetical protein CKA32_003236 [Geitlerinema sp. FC II]
MYCSRCVFLTASSTLGKNPNGFGISNPCDRSPFATPQTKLKKHEIASPDERSRRRLPKIPDSSPSIGAIEVIKLC